MASPAKSEAPNMIPPLSLREVKSRYPRVYAAYATLSDREMDGFEFDRANAAVNDEGLCTTIFLVDFLQPVHEKCVSSQLSDEAYKFFVFLCRMLRACESGSMSGDACRMYRVLLHALGDIMFMGDLAERFQHLLAWTVAAGDHQIYELLYRGDPDSNQYLFGEAGDMWKEIFRRDSNGTPFLTEETRTFALEWCKCFHETLVEAKEVNPDVDYAFHYLEETGQEDD